MSLTHHLRYWNGTDWTGDRKTASAIDITGRIQQASCRPEGPLFGTRPYAKRQLQELADALTETKDSERTW